jgi:hypothetical protein
LAAISQLFDAALLRAAPEGGVCAGACGDGRALQREWSLLAQDSAARIF